VWGFQNSLCSNSDFVDIFSPNHTKATLYIRDCGATTDYVTNIEIGSHKVFVANGYYKDKINMKWGSDLQFVIEYSGKKEDIFSYEKLYKNISIELVQN
jgi:hypothetical protein